MDYLVKTPFWLRMLFPKLLWWVKTSQKVIYLTFDDGPIPEVTPFVLAELKKMNAKATFFCIGNNIEKYPQVFKNILDEGHCVGNHTLNHLNARKVPYRQYVQNVGDCEQLLQKQLQKSDRPKLFRPPYGRLTPRVRKSLLEKGYSIVMWDVLSADFDLAVNPEKCLKNVLKNAKEGSIVVFHDSLKAKEKLEHTLPSVLAHFSKKGYSFYGLDTVFTNNPATS